MTRPGVRSVLLPERSGKGISEPLIDARAYAILSPSVSRFQELHCEQGELASLVPGATEALIRGARIDFAVESRHDVKA